MKYNFSLGISLGIYPTEEIFNACGAAGIRCIELAPHDDDYRRIFADAEKMKKMAEAAGTRIRSLHLPFGMETINFSAPDPEERKRTLKLQLLMLEGAAALGCKYAIVHSGIPVVQAERPICMKQAKEALFALQSEGSRLGITVCVENLLPSCLGRNSTEVLELLSVHPDLRACFDSNHLFGETHEAFLSAVGEKLVNTHFSDYDFLDERHWMPGEGKVDWPMIMEKLAAAAYKGPILYEVNPFRTPKTIARRALTFADYRENHAALCRGEKPAPIGTPIEEECNACIFAERYFKNFGVRYEG